MAIHGASMRFVPCSKQKELRHGDLLKKKHSRIFVRCWIWVVAELLEDGDPILKERDNDAAANRDHWISITI